MSYIDESLAKGLANRFFDETERNVDRILDAVSSKNMLFETKKGWLKKERQFIKAIEPIIFKQHWCGTASKPASAIIGIESSKFVFKDWTERCITGHALYSQYKGVISTEPQPVPFLISHHTLSRLFQRCDELSGLATKWNYKAILQIISPLVAWSGFWSSLAIGEDLSVFRRIRSENSSFEFRPVIPSPYGLFLCECSDQYTGVALRTFVSNKMLRPDQLAVRDILLKCFAGFESCGLEFHPTAAFEKIEQTEVFAFLLKERIARFKNQIKSLIYEGVNPDKIRILENVNILEAKLPQDPFAFEPRGLITEIGRQRRESARNAK
jgi:hypothetical protein